MQSIKHSIWLGLLTALIVSCSSGPKRYSANISEAELSKPITLEEILALEVVESSNNEEPGKVRGLRLRTLRDTAYALGNQAGLAWRSHETNELMEQNSSYIDRIFNFAPFLFDGKILSPTVLEAERIYHQESNNRARTVSVSYVLAKPSRIVPQPPTWREYLTRQIGRPDLPNPQLLPRNSIEKKEWKRYAVQGWQAGLEQANDIFVLDLRRLERDYTGMQRFRMLVKQGIVSEPELSVGEFGIVKDGKTLNVNDVIYEITTTEDFTEESDWQPVFR